MTVQAGDALVGRPRLRWATSRTALWAGAVAVILLLAGAALSIANGGLLANVLSLIFLPFGVVGFIIARRQPRNPIGWILLAILIAIAFAGAAGQYAVLYFSGGHHALPLARVAVFAAAGWIWMVVLMPLPIGLFPDGRLSRRWRIVLWIYLIDIGALLTVFGIVDLTGVLAHHLTLDSSGELKTFGGSQTGWASTAEAFLIPIYVGVALSWVVRQVVAYRGSTGDRREQLKWLISGGLICIVGLIVSLQLGPSHSTLWHWVANLSSLGIIALPVSLGIGILKYRLYEIDRLISRTVSYAIVTGLLVGVYVGMIALTTRLIPLSSSVGVAASTLVAVGLFTPVRRSVQRRVDRRFNRARYDAEAMVATFTTRLRDAVQLETVRGDLLDVVSAAVEPSQVSLWIRPVSRVP
ncbi:MAG TPA: hypothetical protein VGD55_03720 [Acidothermaceae bacterium]